MWYLGVELFLVLNAKIANLGLGIQCEPVNDHCHGRGNSSLHAASVIRRRIIRDDWQQHRKKSDLAYYDGVKPEVSSTGMKNLSHAEKGQIKL